MDPLSVAASVAGLITVSTQILDVICVLSSSNKGLDSVSRELSSVRGILCQIQQIVQFQSAKPNKNSEWLAALNAVLDDCGDTCLELQNVLQGLSSTSKLGALKNKVKRTIKEKDLQDMLRKLESYKLSLDLLLSAQTSTSTTNIEDVLLQVQRKLLDTPQTPPAARTPLSWRKKLAGFGLDSTVTDTSGTEENLSGAVKNDAPGNENANTESYVIPGPETTGWVGPGIYGIDQDDGADAPNLNSSTLVCVCETRVGQKRISLLCDWESGTGGDGRDSLRVHILFKGPGPGDLCFTQIEESHMKKSNERFFVPVGESSLIIGCCNTIGAVCPVSDLENRDDKSSFKLALGSFALKSSPKHQQVLVNFETVKDKDTFLARVYALRYLQRVEFGFRMPLDFYQSNVHKKRIQHVQAGYSDGTEKSWIYPYFYIENGLDGDSLMLAFKTSLSEAEQPFRVHLTNLDIQLVGSETIVFTGPEGNAINTLSATCGTLDELVGMYYRLQDVVSEWKLLMAKGVNEFKSQAGWAVPHVDLGFDKPMRDTRVVAKTDRPQLRFKLDIFSAKTEEKLLATCYITISSIIGMDGDSDWSSLLGVASDLRSGGPVDNCEGSAVTVTGVNAKIWKALEKIASSCVAKSEDAQLQFVKEVGETW